MMFDWTIESFNVQRQNTGPEIRLDSVVMTALGRRRFNAFIASI